MLAITLITSATTTSLKQHQKAAAEREKALAEADKEKLRANLLRAVSHDLRTPLTSIIGSSSSYLENGSDMTEYERTELVSNIKEDSEWLLNMVENLLTITRIDNNSSRQSEEVSGSRRRSRFRGYTTAQKTAFGRPYQSPYAE